MTDPLGRNLRELDLPKPSLMLPFYAQDAAQCGGVSNITEAWEYGQERHITGSSAHRAIDFDLPYGAPVLAMADGWAAYTYQSWLTDTFYRRKRIGMGLGLWVMTLHRLPGSSVYWWGKYGHLSRVEAGIPYLEPTQDNDGDWHEPSKGPHNIYVADHKLTTVFAPIKRGDVLGYVGDTGVEWGYRDAFYPRSGAVGERDRDALPAWDDPHLHLEIYRRVNGSPRWWWQLNTNRISVDPFDRYAIVDRTVGPSPYDGYQLGPNHLWLTDDHGRPLHAAH